MLGTGSIVTELWVLLCQRILLAYLYLFTLNFFYSFALLVDFPRLRYPLPAPLPVQSRNLASSAFCNLPEIDRICSSRNIQFKGNRFPFPWFENTDASTRFASVMK